MFVTHSAWCSVKVGDVLGIYAGLVVWQFKDKIWNSLVSTARYQITNQGRLLFEFDSNCIKVNNIFDTSKSVRASLLVLWRQCRDDTALHPPTAEAIPAASCYTQP
jgi:hypothetical protein